MPQADGVAGSVIVDRLQELFELRPLGRVELPNPAEKHLVNIGFRLRLLLVIEQKLDRNAKHLGDFGNFAQYPESDGLAQGLAVWHIDERRNDNNKSATPNEPTTSA